MTGVREKKSNTTKSYLLQKNYVLGDFPKILKKLLKTSSFVFLNIESFMNDFEWILIELI